MMKNTAHQFWKNATEYPNFDNVKQRRFCEINYLVPRITGKSILDLGCGDGSLLNCLINLVDFDKVYGFDLSENLIKNLHPSINKKVFDFYSYCESDLPVVENTILSSSIQYIFDDSIVLKLLSDLKTKKIFIRSTCTLSKNRILVDSYSDALRDNYSCVYRTVPEIIDILQENYTLECIDRVYPDNIESKFGTKQFYFVGTKLK
jgi:SAM-dependent methyltransferase